MKFLLSLFKVSTVALQHARQTLQLLVLSYITCSVAWSTCASAAIFAPPLHSVPPNRPKSQYFSEQRVRWYPKQSDTLNIPKQQYATLQRGAKIKSNSSIHLFKGVKLKFNGIETMILWHQKNIHQTLIKHNHVCYKLILIFMIFMMNYYDDYHEIQLIKLNSNNHHSFY